MTKRTMKAVLTTGNGGFEKLVYTEVPLPTPGPGEVLIKVLAAGMNNTEINTRLGWYSSSVTKSTNETSTAGDGPSQPKADGGWNQATPFPFIQGTDCCGVVVQAESTGKTLLGRRVLVRPCMRKFGFDSLENIWMGSDFDGAFAQYLKVQSDEVFAVDCAWSDAELGSLPCAYGTAENMLHRSGVKRGDSVLVTGASGGVGSAAVQLAKRRGAKVLAIAGREKHPQMAELQVDSLFDRKVDLIAEIGEQRVDVVVDNVAGENFGTMIKLLKRGGRLTSSGAIAGPIVSFDMRDMYLKDVSFIGTTAWDEPVFANLVSYIENGEIRPLVAATYPLADIVAAQKEFMKKQHVGKFVLIPQH
ncbi:MAG: alcohol dehydrogenase family protein [Desulforhopalus sp.]|nr:alcohol dehydrogenase family protein [Desulforhopalus sp.]